MAREAQVELKLKAPLRDGRTDQVMSLCEMSVPPSRELARGQSGLR
jgi:hypothetical protein